MSNEHQIKLIIAGRRTGKTKQAIDWFMEHPNTRAIAVTNETQRRELLRRIKGRFIASAQNLPENVRTGRCVITARDAYQGRGYYSHMTVREVYVENIDAILTDMFGNVVIGNMDADLDLWPRQSGQKAMWNRTGTKS